MNLTIKKKKCVFTGEIKVVCTGAKTGLVRLLLVLLPMLMLWYCICDIYVLTYLHKKQCISKKSYYISKIRNNTISNAFEYTFNYYALKVFEQMEWNTYFEKKIFIAFLRRSKCHATKIKKFIYINHLPLSNHRP